MFRAEQDDMRSMRHVAIVRAPYVDAILAGRKRVEARLSTTRRPPWGVVHAGDALWIREKGGGYRLRCTISRVLHAAIDGPAGVERLRDGFDDLVLGGDAFWAAKHQARYATLIWLDDVEETTRGPRLARARGDRSAWFVLRRRPRSRVAATL